MCGGRVWDGGGVSGGRVWDGGGVRGGRISDHGYVGCVEGGSGMVVM